MSTSSPIEPQNPDRRWDQLPPEIRKEIDVYETELRRVQAGQMPEKVFLEFRLRHGIYGQRQDGVQMVRIKIPLGMLTSGQMIRLADLAEEYSDGISHVTTRQDIQFHFVDINDTPDIMRRLAEVGITTREACGNVVRNVTACPRAGVCPTQVFDATPHAIAMARFLLRHPDAQNFGRKFKVAYSGCEDEACGLAGMHDIGAIATTREVDGRIEEGFRVYVGGGLGALPHQARLYSDFVPVDEMLPLAQAMSRVFARLGEKQNRAKARMKFLVGQLGVDEFRRKVLEERERLPDDPRWQGLVADAARGSEEPSRPASRLDPASGQDPGFARWLASNVGSQRQEGYSMVEVFLPLGDITSDQLRELALICSRFVNDTVRTTVSQNLLIRWVPNGDLPDLYRELGRIGLARPGAGRLLDVTACPGTDSCKLGITSSRGLAAVMDEALGNGMGDIADRDDIKVKISGCFNSCGQHHIADIGFLGSVQRKGAYTAPVFQVVLGGTTRGNAASYGLVTGKVPARRVPEVTAKLTRLYTREKQPEETFTEFVARLGKLRMKQELEEFELPPWEEAPELYTDNRQTWAYHKETGVGECAGEVVDQAEFMLEEADRLVFEATLALDETRFADAASGALRAIERAADALLSTRGLLLSDRYDRLAEFRTRFYETGEFHRPFAESFFRAAREDGANGTGPEESRRRVEEAALFLEQAQAVYSRA